MTDIFLPYLNCPIVDVSEICTCTFVEPVSPALTTVARCSRWVADSMTAGCASALCNAAAVSRMRRPGVRRPVPAPWQRVCMCVLAADGVTCIEPHLTRLLRQGDTVFLSVRDYRNYLYDGVSGSLDLMDTYLFYLAFPRRDTSPGRHRRRSPIPAPAADHNKYGELARRVLHLI